MGLFTALGAALAPVTGGASVGIGAGIDSARSGTGAAGGLAAKPPNTLETRNAINVAPVGVNFGAMLLPFNEGSSVNGGNPIALQTPFASARVNNPRNVSTGMNNTVIAIALGVIALGAITALIVKA